MENNDSMQDGILQSVVLTNAPFVWTVAYNADRNTSNGSCRLEEKSLKHWSLFTMLLSSVTENFFNGYIKSKAVVCIDCTENQRKIELSQMS